MHRFSLFLRNMVFIFCPYIFCFPLDFFTRSCTFTSEIYKVNFIGLKGLINDFMDATQLDEESFSKSGWPTSAYGISKLGVTILTTLHQNWFDQNQPERNITFYSCCPGFVLTDMTKKKKGQDGMVTPDEGAYTVVYLALLTEDKASQMKGCFVQQRKVTLFPPVDRTV